MERGIDWPKIIVETAHRALEREQNFLSENGLGKDVHGNWTVRKYDEKWIQYLILKEFLGDSRITCAEAEFATRTNSDQKFLDLVIQERQGSCAVIQIKGPADVNSRASRANHRGRLQSDAVNLCNMGSHLSSSRCVLSLVYGDERNVSEWLNESCENAMVCKSQIVMGDERLGIPCFGVTKGSPRPD